MNDASEVWHRTGKCPRCKAEPGDPCRTPSGRLAGMVHAGRPQWQETGSTEQGWDLTGVEDDDAAQAEPETKPVDLVHHAREARQREERKQRRRENRKGHKYHSLGIVIPIERGQQLRNHAKANQKARRAERAARKVGKKNKRRRTDANA